MRKKAFDLHGLQITVTFQSGLVSILCDDQLWLLADRRQRSDFHDLVSHIYQAYRIQFVSDLHIPKRSFLFEIYGHIYADYYLLRYASFFRFMCGRRLYERFLQSCEEIDCGDRANDPNRWFWDMTSVFDFLFYPFFPKNIIKKYAK